MKKSLAVLIMVTAVAWALPAAAEEADPERGARLASGCMGCHGIEGYRNAYPSFRVPKIGGQRAEYIILALESYATGQRGHPTMHAQAAPLSDQDRRDVAAWFAAQGAIQAGPPVATAGADKAAVCAACHGENGISATPIWPSLAGQHRDYLVHALQRYRDASRADPVMGGQAAGLGDADIEALALHFSSQTGLFTPRSRP